MSTEPDGAIDHSGAMDHLRECPKCSERAGRPILRHVSAFRVNYRGCYFCETISELEFAARMKTTDAIWKPSHGPKPLVSDEERWGN